MFTNKTLDPGLMRVSLERQALSIFADNSSQFIFWKDRDSVYQGCNDNFANYAGIADKAQIVGRTDYDLPWSKEEADFFRKIDKAVMDSGEAKLNYEEYQTLSDGKIRWLQISKSPLFDSRGKVYGIVGWYSDITSIKEMQTQINEHTKSMVEYNIRLEDTNKALELANLDLEKFTAAASHDLKSPIRSVMSFAQLLHAKKKDEFDEESMEYLDFIINYAKRMDTLVHDILTYAKSGAKNLKSSHIVLSKLVGHKLLDLQDVINTRSVKVTINLPTKSIACYPELLGMVFYNLVSNGIKFNKSDQPCITIDYSETEDSWIFKVTDNGMGIGQKHEQDIYEPFRRLVGMDFEGSGVGLSICKRVTNIHKGEVWRTANPEGGSTFHFSISKFLR